MNSGETEIAITRLCPTCGDRITTRTIVSDRDYCNSLTEKLAVDTVTAGFRMIMDNPNAMLQHFENTCRPRD